MGSSRGGRRAGAALLVWLVTGWGGRAADPPRSLVLIPGESRGAAVQLEEGKKALAAGQWKEGFKPLLELTEAPQDLVALNEEHLVQARLLAQILLARLRPEGLSELRSQRDPAAREMVEKGLAQRDEPLLRRAVAEAFSSRPAAQALDALGDLAFERGDIAEAAHWWRLLGGSLSPREEEGLTLRYPGAEDRLARVRAKLMLALIFLWKKGDGEVPTPGTAEGANPALARVTGALAAYGRLHPDAEGSLAGRAGRYVDLLNGLWQGRDSLAAVAPADWLTFAGEPRRGRQLPAAERVLDRLGVLCRRPAHRWSLAERMPFEEVPATAPPRELPAAGARSMAFHPLLLGRTAVVADARSVLACDLERGECTEWLDVRRLVPGLSPEVGLPAADGVRYTLTAGRGYLLARLGAQEVQGRGGAERALTNPEGESVLCCLDLGARPPALRWSARAGEDRGAAFEGAPLVHDGRVYIAATRVSEERTLTALYCYALEAPGPVSRPLWVRDICETRELASAASRATHHLLTLAGPNVVYCSHSGAIVAVDRLSGWVAWARRYARVPRRSLPPVPGRETEDALSDLAPPLYAGGKLYVAPSDGDRVLCLDPVTGAALWQRQRLQVVHLLGVGEGRLIFTTPGGLRAVDAATGSDEGGWLLPDSGGRLPPLGRGLLLGDLVLWPTVRGVFPIRQRDGRVAGDPTLLRHVPPGNLVLAQGCLLSADQTTLTAFVPPAWQLEGARRRARQEPDSPSVQLDLALALEDAGLLEEARGQLDRVHGPLKATGREGTGIRKEVHAARGRIRHRTLARLEAEGKWAEAEGALAGDVREASTPGRASQMLLEAAGRWEGRGQAGPAVRCLARVLERGELRRATVLDEDGRPWMAGALARQLLERVRSRHGEEPLHWLNEEAASWPASEPLEEMTERYPGTGKALAALDQLGGRHLEAGRRGAAAQAWRRLLHEGGAGVARARARLGLARAYESQGCRDAARAEWRRLREEHGSRVLPELDANLRVAEVVEKILGSHAYRAAPSGGGIRPPLERGKALTFPEGHRALPGGQLRGPAREILLSAGPGGDGGTLLAWDPVSGKKRWECSPGFVPTWVASHADLLVLGGERGAACVRQEDGEVMWSVAEPAEAVRPWLGFQLGEGRLFCLRDGGELLALEVETGRLLWARAAAGLGLGLSFPQGAFLHPVVVGAGTLLVHSASGRMLLDSSSGDVLHETSTRGAPSRPLRLTAERACVVEGAGRVVCVDMKTGKEVWSHDLPDASLLTGEPAWLVGKAGLLFLMVPTSVGTRVERLDAESGRSMWQVPLVMEEGSLPRGGRAWEQESWALAGEALCHAHAGMVFAWSVRDGSLLWKTRISAQDQRGGQVLAWRLLCGGEVLLACPAVAGVHQIRFRWLTAVLQWGVGLPPEPEPGGGILVACVDSRTGRLLDQARFDSLLGDQQAVAGAVSESGRAERGGKCSLVPGWSYRQELPSRGVEIQRLAQGLAVSYGGHTWYLKVTPSH